MNKLVINNLSKGFGRDEVLHDVSFTVEETKPKNIPFDLLQTDCLKKIIENRFCMLIVPYFCAQRKTSAHVFFPILQKPGQKTVVFQGLFN